MADPQGFFFPTDAPMPASTRQVTDDQLIDRARDGDTVAFGELVDRHRAAVVRAATAALGDRDEAEDVAQDAFVAAWHALASFRRESAFRTWVLAIAWRQAVTRRRSRQGWWSRLVGRGEWQWSEGGEQEPPSADGLPDQKLLDDGVRGRSPTRRPVAGTAAARPAHAGRQR